jgi:hypothetical protein
MLARCSPVPSSQFNVRLHQKSCLTIKSRVENGVSSQRSVHDSEHRRADRFRFYHKQHLFQNAKSKGASKCRKMPWAVELT